MRIVELINYLDIMKIEHMGQEFKQFDNRTAHIYLDIFGINSLIFDLYTMNKFE